jgi:hypothetical protein
MAPFVDKNGLIYVRLDETLSTLMRSLAKLKRNEVLTCLRKAIWLYDNVPREFFLTESPQVVNLDHDAT